MSVMIAVPIKAKSLSMMLMMITDSAATTSAATTSAAAATISGLGKKLMKVLQPKPEC